MKRNEILESAAAIVTGERNRQYGAPEDNFCVIADYWSTYLSRHNGGHVVFITPTDVAVMMALFKIGRRVYGGQLRGLMRVRGVRGGTRGGVAAGITNQTGNTGETERVSPLA